MVGIYKIIVFVLTTLVVFQMKYLPMLKTAWIIFLNKKSNVTITASCTIHVSQARNGKGLAIFLSVSSRI